MPTSPPVAFRHAALVGKFQAAPNSVSQALMAEVAAFLLASGLEVSIERETALAGGMANSSEYEALDAQAIGQRCDLAVVLGGDGTMLGIARQLARFKVPLVGINQGRLGFMTDIPMAQFREALAPILAGEFVQERRSMLEGSVWRDGQAIYSSIALNDVVVSRGATASMVELSVEVDGDFVANMRADGLIVATPTGATAYALSAGGPILHPALGGFALVPIAAHTLSNRPIVLPEAGEVRIGVVAGKEVAAHFDMQSLASLLIGDQIRVRRSAHEVRFLHPQGWSYYATLRRKLRWNEGGA